MQRIYFLKKYKKVRLLEKNLPKRLQKNLFYMAYDACDNSSFEELKKTINCFFKKPHILINNVGGGGRWGNEEFEDTDDRVWNEVFAKNVEISYLLTMYVLKEMIPNKWGRIINIASIFGKV